MAKKNLSNLLREEVQKGTNSEDETVNNNDNEVIDVPAVEAEEVTEEVSANDQTHTTVELETTVAQLQVGLDTAKANEVSWQKEIGELRSHLIKSQQNEAKLEKQLAELRSELETQKKLLKQQEQKLEKN